MTSPSVPTLTGRLRLALQAGFPLPDDPGLPLHQPPAAMPTAPALLAQAHASPRARHASLLLYTRCLKHFRLYVQQGAESDDAALAAAYFVLASLAAARGLEAGEQDLARVERQMRHRMRQSGFWLDAPLADRQSAFEQFALVGVLVSESAGAARLQGRAAVQNVQQAARGYLVQMLGLDADRLTLGAQGLTMELAAA